MIEAEDAVVWINGETKQIMVWPTIGKRVRPSGMGWADPIGAAYTDWRDTMTDEERLRLMLETAIDLAMQGFALKDVLIAFAEVRQFPALGTESYPMYRALTKALVGRTLEPNTMSFEELLVHYAKKVA